MKREAKVIDNDESELTEIMIRPDGRVYVFGLSLPVLELLSTLRPGDQQVAARLSACQAANEFSREKCEHVE